MFPSGPQWKFIALLIRVACYGAWPWSIWSANLQTFVVGWNRSLVFHVHQGFCCTYEAKTAKRPHKWRVCRILRWHLVVKQLPGFWCWIGEARPFSRPNIMEGSTVNRWLKTTNSENFVCNITNLFDDFFIFWAGSRFKRGRVSEMRASDSNSILWNTFRNTQFAQKYMQ